SALAGRDSRDYYEASVAIGLASRRRSRVRPCCTYRAERRGPTHLLECHHWASPCAPAVAPANPEYQRRARHRLQASYLCGSPVVQGVVVCCFPGVVFGCFPDRCWVSSVPGPESKTWP